MWSGMQVQEERSYYYWVTGPTSSCKTMECKLNNIVKIKQIANKDKDVTIN